MSLSQITIVVAFILAISFASGILNIFKMLRIWKWGLVLSLTFLFVFTFGYSILSSPSCSCIRGDVKFGSFVNTYMFFLGIAGAVVPIILVSIFLFLLNRSRMVRSGSGGIKALFWWNLRRTLIEIAIAVVSAYIFSYFVECIVCPILC